LAAHGLETFEKAQKHVILSEAKNLALSCFNELRILRHASRSSEWQSPRFFNSTLAVGSGPGFSFSLRETSGGAGRACQSWRTSL